MPRPTSVLDYAAPTAATVPPAANKRPRPNRIADIAALVNETMPSVEADQLWRAVRPGRGRVGPIVHVHHVHPTEVVVSTVGDLSNPPHLITVARRRFKEAANGFVLVTPEEATATQDGSH